MNVKSLKYFDMKKITLIIFLLFSLKVSAQWVQTGNGITGNAIINSMLLNGSDLYACSYSINLTGGIFKSSNDGLNWSQIPFENHIASVLLIKNGIFIASIAGVENGGVYVSSNGGNNWIQSSLNNRTVGSMISLPGNYVCAGTHLHGIYFSSNNGFNWSQSSLTNKSLLCFAADSSVVFAGTEGWGVYSSTDNGANWTQTSFNTYSIYSLAVSGNKICAGTVQHGVFMSTNRGTDWFRIYPDYTSIRSIIIDNNIIYLGLNYNGNGGVAVSTNNGVTWFDKNQGFVPSSLGVGNLILHNNYIFAGTPYSVWRRGISEILNVQNLNTETPHDFSLSQNYPNPFNPSTTIRFALPKSSFVRITVYENTGKVIETILNDNLQAGTYETKWDGTKYSSGVYFYRMDAGALTETKRMLLIK